MVTNALMKIVKSGKPVLSEYAAEDLGSIGARIAVIASRIISWLFSLIKPGHKREAQGAAITALTEIAYKTSNKNVDKIVKGLAEALDEPDDYIRERALRSLERLITKRDMISKQTLSLTLKKLQPLLRDEKLKDTANLVMERILKIAQVDEGMEEVLSYRKKLEVEQYNIGDIETLIDSGKQEVVVLALFFVLGGIKLPPQFLNMLNKVGWWSQETCCVEPQIFLTMYAISIIARFTIKP